MVLNTRSTPVNEHNNFAIQISVSRLIPSGLERNENLSAKTICSQKRRIIGKQLTVSLSRPC